ncbi:MAG TPA: hypothetical protein VGC39_09820, partial [Candidatus Methylacidiphilales bacterium]
GTLGNVDAAGSFHVLGSDRTFTGFPSYLARQSYSAVTNYYCWDGTNSVTLPQPSGVLLAPAGVNGASATVVNGASTNTVSATQIVGNGTGGAYLWEMVPSTNSVKTFNPPVNLNSLLAPSSGYSVNYAASINDSGAMAASVFKSSDSTTRGGLLIPSEVCVDANRDGTIVMANEAGASQNAGLPVDQTTQTHSFRYWVNSFDERNETDNAGSTYQDSNSTTILDERDLENFTRLWIYNKVPSGFFGSTKIQFGLKWKSVTGSPSIRLFRAYEADGGTKYVTDASTAAAIYTDGTGKYSSCVLDKSSRNVVTPVSGAAADFIFADGIDNAYSPTAPKQCFIFEGVGVGQGELVPVYLNSSGTEIGEGPGVWIDLENIKTMYKSSDADQFVQPWDEAHQGIVFVHGWNMSPNGSRTFAEDMFKRLWHRGYKGRFCYFRWATGAGPFVDDDSPPTLVTEIDGYLANYNTSEYTAWHTGAALDAFIAGAVPRGYTKNLAAHSMGNIVVGSGFLNGLHVDHYAMLQAAVPSCCYDTSTSRQQTTPTTVAYDIAGFTLNVTLWGGGNHTPDDDPDSATSALAYRGR